MDTNLEEIDINKTDLSWKCFETMESGGQLDVNLGFLCTFLKQDLHVNLDDLQPEMKDILPYMLVVFMKTWPGWIFHDTMSLEKKYKYSHFKNYLISKIKYVIEGGFKTAIAENGDTKSLDDARFSPYNLQIGAPPNLVNSIVFTRMGENDVIMKQHVGRKWDKVTTSQLINWPNIEVRYVGQDLSFVRRVVPEFVRYLNFMAQERPDMDPDAVENIEAINDQPRECYTLRFLNEYTREYVAVLKTFKAVNEDYIDEIQSILHNFIEDIKDIKANATVATNTKILFKNDGGFTYIRNKKLVKDVDGINLNRVGYCEFIIPKVEFFISNVKVKQVEDSDNEDVSPTVPFDYTNEMRKKANMELNVVRQFLPIIVYKCLFCNVEFVNFNSKRDIIMHLMTLHKMEHPVRCTKCKRQFDVTNLASNRWKHFCVF